MLRANQFDNAELALKTILAQKSDDPQAEFLLGVAIQKQKRYADAKPHFERVIALQKTFPEIDYVFHFLGWCNFYLGPIAIVPEAQLIALVELGPLRPYSIATLQLAEPPNTESARSVSTALSPPPIYRANCSSA